ncbi:MAG: hypothetical protein LBE02_07325 [Spirochaetaceae bacterium]|jgi:hypothetical protein|nr:hypothetical protein [Spirochaetaceae bacterium]
MKRLLYTVCLLCVSVFLEAQGAVKGRPEIPGNANLKQLLAKPSFIYTGVDSVKEGGKTWVVMEVDVQTCSPLSLEQIKAVITDYANYAKIFKRTTASRVAGGNERGIIAFFEITVGVMGVTAVTAYSVLMETPLDSPGKFLLNFSHVSDNGSIRKVHGFWYLETVTIDERPHTYLRYYAYSEPLRVMALQKQVTSLFIGAEYEAMIEEVLAAAALRGATR